MKKILVLGKNGQLAQAIDQNRGPWKYEFLDKDDIDLSNPKGIAKALEGNDFDILINAAAYTAVDKAESEIELCQAINAIAPGELASLCQDRRAVLIHISTDYVFSNDWNRPLEEDFPADPINEYGKSKWLGEEVIRKYLKSHIIIRTSWLYGLAGHNFPKTMLRLAESRDELNVVFDQVGNPTFADDLAVAIREICASDLGIKSFGTYHFSNEGVCSWYDFAREILGSSRQHVLVNPVTSEEFPTPAKRPNYSVLNKKKIKDTFELKIRHWKDALADFLEKREL